MSPGHVSRTDDGVLVVTIDHLPVNAIALPVRRLLFDALGDAARDTAVRAVVVTGGAKLFSAGADLGEFAAGTAMDDPSLHVHIAGRIASLGKPVVAAVHGAALGGGFELALLCHRRVFATATRVGLPETTLGLMPGAGGTQLLPRAIGIEAACRLIVDGRVVAVETIAGPRLADAIVPVERLVAVAMDLASRLAADGPSFAALSDDPVDDPHADATLGAAAAALDARPDALPGQRRAIEAIALSTRLRIADGMRREHALFVPLLASRESLALRHLFVAERRRGAGPAVDEADRAIVARVDARLARECAALHADGIGADDLARALANWGWRWRVPRGDVRGEPAAACDAAVVDRLVAAAVEECHAALRDGLARSADDVDVALVRHGNFPRARGGPLFHAATTAHDDVPVSAAVAAGALLTGRDDG